jgi:hypothetical protein
MRTYFIWVFSFKNFISVNISFFLLTGVFKYWACKNIISDMYVENIYILVSPMYYFYFQILRWNSGQTDLNLNKWL